MQVVKGIGVSLVCGFLMAQGLRAAGQTNAVSEPSGATTSTNVDNTANNSRDRDNATLTPGDQGNSKSDVELTRKIRRALMKKHELSMTAKNIKIITIDGKVTLRGPVKTDEERQTINQIAQEEGATSLDNQLEVKEPKQ
jgi:hyperosmotically inducible periplasmic protein